MQDITASVRKGNYRQKKAFNTTGEFILQDGTEIERETGLAWFDTEIKKAVDELNKHLLDIFDDEKEFLKVKEMIQDHFKALDEVN